MLVDARLAAWCLTALAMTMPARAEPGVQSLVGAGSEPPMPWHVVGLPRQSKPFTRFTVAEIDGQRALRIEADRSYGNLVHLLVPQPAPLHLAWRWRVEEPLLDTDLRQRAGDDSEVKVCVFFDEPMEHVSFGERQLLRLARAGSADPIPTATVCYVWDSRLPAGTAIDNAFTRRIRYLVLESGTGALHRWVAEQRDLAADFKRLFGSECPTVPPVVGIAVGADADNTRGHSVAWLADLARRP
jgi:hypothetical protein